MNRGFYANNLWRWKVGLQEIVLNTKVIDLIDLQESEWCKEFEQLMRNRLLMGGMRYGLMGEIVGKPNYDRISSIIERLELYKESGNLEHLVDGANLCMMEFVEGNHPQRHFHSTDDGVHTGVKE